MTVTAILSVFAGMIIGLRIRVQALVPAMLIAGTTVSAVFAIGGSGFLAAMGAAAITIITVQIGYLCSTFAISLKEPASNPDVIVAPATSPGPSSQSAALRR